MLFSTTVSTHVCTIKKSTVMNLKILQKIALFFLLSLTSHFIYGQCTAELTTASGFHCSDELVDLTIEFTGDGPWELDYSIDGVPQPTLIVSTSPYVIQVAAPGGTYTLDGVSSPTCSNGTASGEANLLFNTEIIIGCDGQTIEGCGDIILDCPVFGGSPPYLFSWSNGTTDPNPPISVSGTYVVTVTDANGCEAIGTFIAIVTELDCEVTISGELSCVNPTVTLSAQCGPGNQGMSFLWEDENGNILSNDVSITVTEPGTYLFEAIDFTNGCSYEEIITLEEGTEECGVIQGKVTIDDDGDCTFDVGEQGLSNWMVKATETTSGDEFFALTDGDGNYSISVLPGSFTIDLINPSTDIWLPCESAIPVTVDDVTDVETADFNVGTLMLCPHLTVDLGAPFFRRCFETSMFVQYANLGSQVAEDAFIELTIDPFISILTASHPFTGPVDNVYTFDLGDLGIGESGTIQLTIETSCNSALGQTLCNEANIFPTTNCIPTDPSWSGASLELTSECDGDDLVFTITNVGTEPMTEPLIYIVIEDGVMMMEENDGPPLAPGESHTITVPANGSTYVLDVPQVTSHPGSSNPLLAIEGCGTNGSGTFSMGFVNQFPMDDEDDFIAIDCREVIGAFDPNDKRGFPMGFGENRFIDLGQDLEYHIRFQNTGTDTAFNVYIEDVISEKLDLATFRPGASSHPYEVEFRGTDTVVFLFPNIMLPDSNVNEPLSHGFVKFKIEQAVENELGDVIENTAGIYFDFNEPVITNTTIHRLGEEFVPSSVFETNISDLHILAQPNPTSGETTFQLLGNLPNGAIEIHLFDTMGKQHATGTFFSPSGTIDLGHLPNGLYFFQLKMEGGTIGSGRILKQ